MIRPSSARSKTVGLADTCKPGQASVGVNYTNAVLRAGLIPVLLPCTDRAEAVRQMVERVDALLLPGGGSDVDPALFGAARSPYLGEVVAERDAFEYALLREAVRQQKPVLGICRGIQVINVFFGGTLYQDLADEFHPSSLNPSLVDAEGACESRFAPLLNHQRPDKEWDVVHEIRLVAGSRLERLLGAEQLGVNSTHHQAVAQVAPGFRISAISPDGVIEAIEHTELPILGVQFHPERLLDLPDSPFIRLFEF